MGSDDDWFDRLDDLGVDTPPGLIDEGIARVAGAADVGALYLRASLFLLRHVQATFMPGRVSPPGDLDEAVRAGQSALDLLWRDDDGHPELESAVLQVLAEAWQLRDAPGDGDRAIDVMNEATRRFPQGSVEQVMAVSGLADRCFARYAKHHRAADFAATEQALQDTLDGGWPDRGSLWLRRGSLYEERFRAGGDPRDHRRALDILRTGWVEGWGYPLLALSYADAVVNSGAEPEAGDLDIAIEQLAAVDLGELPAMMEGQFHELVMATHFRRHRPADLPLVVAAAGRVIAHSGTEAAEARWVRATARLDHASITGDRMVAIEPIVADLTAAYPLLNADQRRQADAQLTRMLAERARRTGDRHDAEAAEAAAIKALERLSGGTAERAEVHYHLAYLLVSRAEDGRGDATTADRGIALFRQVVEDPAASPKIRSAAAAQLATATSAGFFYQGGDPAALNAAITLAGDALRATSLDDMNRVALAASVASALLVRFEMRGDLTDLRWCLDLLRDARHGAADDPHRHELTLTLAQARIMWAEAVGQTTPDDTLTVLADVLASARPGDARRIQALRSLAGGYAMRAQQTGHPEDWRRAALYARELLDGLPSGASFTGLMRMSGGGTLMLAGRALDDLDLVREGADLVGSALREPASGLLRGRNLALYGMALFELHQRAPHPGDLERAVDALREANALAADEPGQRGAAEIGIALAAALAATGDPAGAVEAGRAALRQRAWQVLLQSGTHDAMTTARRSANDALQVARAALRAGDQHGAWLALETGRGLVLHAATVASTVPELLRGAGRTDLAGQWSAGPPAADGARWRTAAPAMPSDAHFQALGVLARDVTLFDPPPVEAVGAALTTLDADALVYLFPGTPGFALIVEPGGRVDTLDLPGLTGDWAIPEVVQQAVAARDLSVVRAKPAVGRSLSDVCRAAWDVAIGPLLDHWKQRHAGEPHLVLVPDGALATVPWHAAHRPERWAIDEAAFSYIASGRLLVDVAGRAVPPPGHVGLVIGNPDTGDPADALPNAGAEASTIFREHYAAGRYCGRPDDPSVVAHGPGRPEDVFGWLTATDRPLATVLHLACHGVVQAEGAASSYLVLAGGTRVSAEELLHAAAAREPGRSPGLVSLAACTTHRAGHTYDEAVTLSTAFLAAGATTAIGSLWPVPDRETARLMVTFHDNLAGRGLPPHAALREAQRAMRTGATLGDWAGFVHLGR